MPGSLLMLLQYHVCSVLLLLLLLLFNGAIIALVLGVISKGLEIKSASALAAGLGSGT